MNLYDKASLILTPNAYKASKIYVAKPTDGSGDLTFSRASTAMRRNAAGLWESVSNNIPRLHYPVGGGCPSWLMEPAATNIVFNSLGNAATYSLLGGASVSDFSISTPFNGVTSAVKISTVASFFSGVSKSISRSSAINVTWCIVKKGTLDFMGMVDVAGGGVKAWFNIANGTLGTVSLGYNARITSEGDGWYRCELTKDTADAASYFQIMFTNTNGSSSGAVGDSYLCFEQNEIGSTATSPIITAGSTVTRLDDEAFKTGASEMIGQTEGTLYVDCIGTKDVAATPKFLTQILGSKNIGITTYSNVINILSGAIDASFPFTVGTRYKVAVCYRDSDNSFRIFINGAKTHDLSTYVAGTYNSFGVGCRATYGDVSANTTIKDAIFYKTAISDSEAIALTTL